jgi:hypothetical protein
MELLTAMETRSRGPKFGLFSDVGKHSSELREHFPRYKPGDLETYLTSRFVGPAEDG